MSRKRWRSWLTRGAIVVTGLLALYLLALAKPKTGYFVERAGEMESAEPAEAQRSSGWIAQDIVLRSDSGLVINLRTRRPDIDGRVPLVVMIGGERTGRRAVDLVEKSAGIAYAAIDYPFAGDRDIRGLVDGLRTMPAIQRAFLDTPSGLMLATSWLESQSWVDSERMELVGVSLGVPFAAVAGALDERLSRVWLIHGAVDNVSWINHALKPRIGNDLLRGAAARLANLLVNGKTFQTALWISQTAPRPVVLVAAREDERVPEDGAHSLQAITAQNHVELVWTEGRHIGPRRLHELQQLIAIVQSAINRTGE